MFGLSITISGVEEWQRYLEDIRIIEHVDPRLARLCDDIVLTARSIAPRRTGEYAAGIGWRKIDVMKYLIFASAPHSAIVESGSRPHFILPREKKVLRFEVGGEVVFAKWVMHPGTAGQHILHTAKKAHISRIGEVVREGVREALGK